MATRIIDLLFLLIIPALIYFGLFTEDLLDYGYNYPAPAPAAAAVSANGSLGALAVLHQLSLLGTQTLGWLRFHTGELIHYVPALIIVVYLLAIKSPFSLFSRTALMTILAVGGYHLVMAETLYAAEHMGNLPYWLRREFPSVVPLLVPITVLAALIGCGRLILRLLDPPPPERESAQ